jgi:hypothetical protein
MVKIVVSICSGWETRVFAPSPPSQSLGRRDKDSRLRRAFHGRGTAQWTGVGTCDWQPWLCPSTMRNNVIGWLAHLVVWRTDEAVLCLSPLTVDWALSLRISQSVSASLACLATDRSIARYQYLIQFHIYQPGTSHPTTLQSSTAPRHFTRFTRVLHGSLSPAHERLLFHTVPRGVILFIVPTPL